MRRVRVSGTIASTLYTVLHKVSYRMMYSMQHAASGRMQFTHYYFSITKLLKQERFASLCDGSSSSSLRFVENVDFALNLKMRALLDGVCEEAGAKDPLQAAAFAANWKSLQVGEHNENTLNTHVLGCDAIIHTMLVIYCFYA